MTDSYSILVGVGELWVAPIGTAFPDVNATPSTSWTNLGDTRDGVKFTKTQKVNKIRHDQRTGGVKAVRSEEDAQIETKLPEVTLENLARVLGTAVTTVAAGVGTIGTKTIGLHQGSTVTEYAILLRGDSPYGAYPAQYQIPRGYFEGDLSLEMTNEDEQVIGVTITVLEDLSESTEAYRFGKLVAQTAVAES